MNSPRDGNTPSPDTAALTLRRGGYVDVATKQFAVAARTRSVASERSL
jgi:hypothetical protein